LLALVINIKIKDMKFKNKKGKELKTTMSNDIMNQVAEITELELKSKGIFYLRNGTKFSVKQDDVNNLLNAQMEANKKLIKDCVITSDMIKNDIKSNF
tara:strand:+ start:50 stop:343 length:294 start_codon:yes stop_codon:yes gene_type:complete